MRIIHDPDEYTVVTQYRKCTSCNGDMSKCNGGCNGMSSFGLVKRPPDEVRKIKAEKMRITEDEILAQAEVIKARRRT